MQAAEFDHGTRRNVLLQQDVTYNLDISKSFGHGIYYLRFFGFWQFEYDHTNRWKTWLQKTMSHFSTMTMLTTSLLSILYLIFSSTTDVSVFIYNLVLFFRMISVLYAILTFKASSRKIQVLLDLFTNISAPHQITQLVDNFKHTIHNPSRRIYLFYFAMFTPVLPNVLFGPFLAEYFEKEVETRAKFRLPARLWHPFDFEKYPFTYSLMYTFEVVFGIPGLVLKLGLNILYLSIAITACRLLDHLSATLKEIQQTGRIKFGSFWVKAKKTNETYQIIVERVLKYAVQHHQRTIQFVDVTNEIYSHIMMADMWVIALAVGSMALQMINPDVTWEQFSSALQILIFELTYFCVICYFSNEMILKSTEQLQSSCYGSVVLNWSSSNQRTARIIGLRANASALQLRAGPFYTLSLSTFRAILGISVTFFSFLHQVQKWKS